MERGGEARRDNLQDLLDSALTALAGGAATPESPWRMLALATSHGGLPGIRTIVLRGFDPVGRLADLHTDVRSGKIAAITRNPGAALHGWDPVSRLQLRLDGTITIAQEAEAEAAWEALPETSRATYAVTLPPGAPIADPGAARQDLPPAGARAVFRLLRLRYEVLEVLSLEHGRHRRARFGWPAGELAATWLVP